MMINIKEICGNQTVTRDEGKKIFDLISLNWESADRIHIDFGGILVASVSFLDEAIGRIALQHSKEMLQKK